MPKEDLLIHLYQELQHSSVSATALHFPSASTWRGKNILPIIAHKPIVYRLRDSHSETPATAVRFGNCPELSVGRHLTGQKGSGRLLRTRPWAVYFFAVRRTAATCERRTAACVPYLCSARKTSASWRIFSKSRPWSRAPKMQPQ